MGPKQCQVCNEAQSKYKCPTCLVPYCSLGCFKKHKVIPCVKPTSIEEILTAIDTKCIIPAPSEEKIVVNDSESTCVKPSTTGKSTTDVELDNERPFFIRESSERLKKFQLESIASCSEICDALKDEDLHELIYNIDSSPLAENELDKAMKNEAFEAFADKILSAISKTPASQRKGS